MSPEETDSAQARRLARRLLAIEPGSLQDAAAARELARLAEDPERGAWVLASLISEARTRGRSMGLALEAIGRALLAPPDETLTRLHRYRLRQVAREEGLKEVAGLFVAPPPVLALGAEDQPYRPDSPIAHLSLGHKKALARKANPDQLARLAAEGDPSVVRNILINPRVSESLVVRICARRPILHGVFREVWANRKWSSREAVRHAIVQNPYCEPELAMKVLPTLGEPMLALVARNKTLHLSLREAAERLRRKHRVEEAPIDEVHPVVRDGGATR